MSVILTVIKDGGSKCVTIPRDIAIHLGIEYGTKLNMELDKKKMILEKME